MAETIADWVATTGTVGIRLMMHRGVSTDPADPGLNRVLTTAARHALPVNLMCTGRSEQAAQLAGRAWGVGGRQAPSVASTARQAERAAHRAP